MPLTLEIVTPEARALTVSCDEVRLTSVEGGFGVRPGHTPLVAVLAAGELAFLAQGREHKFAAGEGFAEISDDRVRVLVEEFQRAEDLDPEQMKREYAEKQQRLLSMRPGDPTYALERAKVERAAARAFVSGRR